MRAMYRFCLALAPMLSLSLSVFHLTPARATPPASLLGVIPRPQPALGAADRASPDRASLDRASPEPASAPALRSIAFREAVAAQYRIDSAQIQVRPAGQHDSLAITPFAGLSPYVARAGSQEFRGWVDDRGAVVLTDDAKLGRLLRSFDLRADNPKLSPLAMAERLAWMLGPGLRLVRRPLDLPRGSRDQFSPPQRRAVGGEVLALRFQLKQAVGPGQVLLYEVTLRCHADYQTQLHIQRL